MARVVARRGSSQSRGQLVLLITFAFLFVAVAILASMSYSQMDKVEKGLISVNADVEKQSQAIKAVKRDHRDLTFLVTGSDGAGHVEAVSISEQAYLNEDVKAAIEESRGGLAPDMEKLAKMLTVSNGKIKELQGTLGDSNDTIAQKDVAERKLKKAHDASIAEAGEENKKLKGDVNVKQTEVEAAIARGAADLQKQRADLNKEIKAREDRIQELSGQTVRLDKTIVKLKEIIKDLQGEEVEALPDLEPDGQIVRVAEDDLICYINVGSEKGIKPGMTFTISPKGQSIEVKRDAKGGSAVMNVKGFIRVISPKKGFSECIIVKDDPDNPFAAGDNITNAAFRAARNYKFVVKGLFDLHGLGHATRSGRREVEQIITKFGGKVVPEIDFMTDYIVVGVEPKTPPQPASDATDSVRAAYKRQKKQYDDYQAIFTEAKKIGIPVLSQNRFLIFTGYMPEKEEE